jgi:hypothetical protein
MSLQPLDHAEIKRLPDGRYELTRSRADGGGERFECRDLIEVFACIRAAYWPDGEPRPVGCDGVRR